MNFSKLVELFIDLCNGNKGIEVIDEQTEKAIERNIYWKEQLGWSYGDLARAFGARNLNVETSLFVREVKDFQKRKGLSPDGILGPATYRYVTDSLMTDKDRAIQKIVDCTIARESGGNYAAMNLDGEFKGKFDRVWLERHGKKHPASGKCHIGLSFGIIQFTQDGGSLGKLLQRAAKKNPDRFKQVFGPTWQELLEVVTTPGKSGFSQRKLRGPRVRKVRVPIDENEMAERDLWEKPWTDKFKRFGKIPEFQAVQRELAIEEYLLPILPTLKEKGWLSEKAVAVAFDGAVHSGVGGMRSVLNSLASTNEKEALEELASKNSRRASVINDNDLSYSEWDGWNYLEI